MHLVLSKAVEKLLKERMRAGGYASAEEAVEAGLRALAGREDSGDLEAGEMEILLAEGEASGEPLDGDSVLNALRELRSRR
jgi:Arc/MetJ-type ribon-helix-helix transcriptional regulator